MCQRKSRGEVRTETVPTYHTACDVLTIQYGPPVSEKRLFLTARGEIGYTLKTPYRDGTTHVIFEPLDFIARLAARTGGLCQSASCLRQTALRQTPVLVPPPRLNLTRFHSAGESDRTSCAKCKQ